ncbi:CLUMA_CG021418, isoform A [Clunio marinus]|uniref:CLUMA_CG021418, isoform A n=1 Tax=Clunio marinus TaxID=568069 RepID=A0A1J1J7R8_9DIPT|nr:CLUMA_CG021418, isoform A [Clunio marinus]
MGEELSALLTDMAQLGIEIKKNNVSNCNVVNEEDELKQDEEIPEVSPKMCLRKRASCQDTLHRTRNRKITKPKRNSKNAMQFETEKQTKNFYLNINKKVKLKPTILETIYEQDESLSDVNEEKKKETGRKLKRTLAICDGLNITKSLKDKRKNLIKKHLGNKKRPKKIALAKFMEYFKEKIAVSSSNDVMETIEW